MHTTEQVLLYYKYVAIQYPKQVQKWQAALCAELKLKGRVIIATEGINGTLAGAPEALEAYKQAMEAHPLFGGIDFKDSEGASENFPRMRIVVKDEIVRFGIAPDALRAEDGGRHLTPAQAHELLSQHREDLVIFDGRNNYESRIGAFAGAITPDLQTFREFPAYIDNNIEQFKDKTVLMYCTGGVRCERLSAYLKTKNVAKEVVQIQGGIHRYAEQFPNGFFKGKNYVFDARIAMKVSDDILGTCDLCSVPCDEYTNCINTRCNKQIIACDACLQAYNITCGKTCYDLVTTGAVKVRTKYVKQIGANT
jgi:predicted sulfurtransferase